MAANPSSTVDDAAFSVRRTIRIAAPVAKVWAAVTEPEHISRWFGRAEFEGSYAGARGTLTWPDRAPIPVRLEAIEAQRMVSYRWSNDDASGVVPDELDESRSTVFTFTLVEVSDGTELTVVETGFEATSDPAANLADHRDGWNGELDKLVALLESGS
ncbi:SRPBCC domain-containing protein [Microbacterium sp. HJ5]